MSAEEHSTALSRLVQNPDDIVGLLAYAYYKLDKRDTAIGGNMTAAELDRYHLILTDRLISQHRDNALSRLEQYAERIVVEATPQIREQTRTESIESAATRVIAEVRDRTVWWHSIVWNVVAWLLSLAITLLVLIGSGKVSINVGG